MQAIACNRKSQLLAQFECVSEDYSGYKEWYAPDEITFQFPNILLEIEMLLFNFDPRIPLLDEVRRLDAAVERVSKTVGDRFTYDNMNQTKHVLEMFLDSLIFRREP